MGGLNLPYAGSVATDEDLFSVKNNLGAGQSDKDTSRVASVVGHGGICHGVHGDNGNGSGTRPQYGVGVWGDSDNGFGVYGASKSNSGVHGISSGFDGVHGESQSSQHAGVSGLNNSGGTAKGVYGASSSGTGVAGSSQGGVGVSATSQSGTGVTASGGFAGLFVTSDKGTAIVAQSNSGYAAQFTGPVTISGNLSCADVSIASGDCAEEFDAAEGEQIDPGTVVVIGDMGTMRESRAAYDKRVAGVISSAGNRKPGIVLGRSRQSDRARASVALVGNVYCKVDASYSAVDVGDLLTTSPTPGYAMKATDPARAFGAVIGKALESLSEGQGLIAVLVALQ